MCQRPGIVGTADPEPVSTSMLDLDRALGNASFNDRRFILIQGLIHDLNRKKTWHTRRCQFRAGRKARVMQPFEDQIRIHRIPARDLRDRYARRHRLKTDRPLLVVCPKPLRSTRHPKPRSVHYPWWTLSDPSTARQSGQAGRLQYKAAITLLNYRHVCRLDHWPPALAQSVADWNMDPYMAVQGPNEFVYIGNLKDWNRLDDMANFTEPSGQTANAGATGEVCVPAIMQLLLCRLRAGCGRFLLQE